MMEKHFSVGPEEEAQGFPLLSVIHHEYGRATSNLLKMASSRKFISEDVRSWIEAQPYSGAKEATIFVSALGADEYWGANRRHDGWPEVHLSHKGASHGFQTYTKHGHTYLHHQNRSTMQAVGKVVYASWNPRMHRVEIIQTVKRAHAPEVVARIDRGEMVSTSMGARVPYDQCSLCGHQAKTAAYHCEHIRKMAGEMMEDGQRVRMLNPYPKFFDGSIVSIPAAPESGQLLDVTNGIPKAASIDVPHFQSSLEGNWIFGDGKEARDKDAYLRKQIDLDISPVEEVDVEQGMKNLDAMAETDALAPYADELINLEPTLPEHVLEKASSLPFLHAASSFSAVGIPMRPEEFQYIFLTQLGHPKEASILYRERIVLHASPCDRDVEPLLKVAEDYVDQGLVEAMVPHLPTRSVIEPFLSHRVETFGGLPDFKIAEEQNTNRLGLPSRTKPSSGFSSPELLAALALGYALYRKMAPPGLSLGTVEKSMERHPWMIPAVFLSGAWGIKALTDTIRGSSTTKVGGAFWHYAAPLGGAYLLSASARRKEWEGYQLGSLEKTVRSYPLPVGLLGVVGARKLTKPLSKIRGAVSQAAKKASDLGHAAQEAGLATMLGWYSPYKFPAALTDFFVMNKIFPATKATQSKAVVGSKAIPSARD